MKDCILCKVAAGELPSHRIYEDDYCIGILDITPCAAGHCLIVPKKHVEKFYDLSDEDLMKLFSAAKKVAKKIKKAYSPDHVCIFARGGRLPHLHIALFPSNEGDNVSGFPQSNFSSVKVDLAAEAEKLRKA